MFFSLPFRSITAREPGSFSFRAALLHHSQIRFNVKENLSSYLEKGCENYPDRNTKRGYAYAFLCKVPSIMKLPTFRSTTALQHCN